MFRPMTYAPRGRMSQPAAVASASVARSSPRCQLWSSRPRLPRGSSRLWSGPATKPSSEIDMWQVVSGISVLSEVVCDLQVIRRPEQERRRGSAGDHLIAALGSVAEGEKKLTQLLALSGAEASEKFVFGFALCAGGAVEVLPADSGERYDMPTAVCGVALAVDAPVLFEGVQQLHQHAWCDAEQGAELALWHWAAVVQESEQVKLAGGRSCASWAGRSRRFIARWPRSASRSPAHVGRSSRTPRELCTRERDLILAAARLL